MNIYRAVKYCCILHERVFVMKSKMICFDSISEHVVPVLWYLTKYSPYSIGSFAIELEIVRFDSTCTNEYPFK